MSYAKAIYPYQTGVTGDLELQIDDIIEVKEVELIFTALPCLLFLLCKILNEKIQNKH